MKRFLGFVLAFAGACASPVVAATIHVAPDGNDAWSGTRAVPKQSRTDGPLATLPAAIERARSQRRAAPGVPVELLLRGGVYQLTDPLVFLPEDSGLIIAAKPGEDAVITSETRIAGWKRSNLNSNIWETEVPAAREGGWVFRELFVNGRRRQRARLPASGFFRTTAAPTKEHPDQVQVNSGDVRPGWALQGDVELVLLPAWEQLRNQIRSVSGSDSSTVISLSGDAYSFATEANTRYYVENVPDSLQTGQWYLNTRTGVVAYWQEPGEDMGSAVVTSPHLHELVKLQGQPGSPVRGIVFRRLTFAGTDWPLVKGSDIDYQAAVEIGAAFQARWAESCQIQQCLFTRLGGYAVDFNRGCRNNSVVGCEMADLGGGGVRLGEAELNNALAAPNSGNRVTDNHIHHIGLVNAPAVGVLVLLSASNTIAHNEIDHTFYTAVSVGWTWGYGPTPCRGNIVEYNHLHDIGQGMLSDMGGVYTLGLQAGAVVRNNLIHDVNIFSYGGWGLYTDEGSSGIVLESNVVYRCQSAGFHQHYGETNRIANNIFALNKEAQLQRTRAETHCSFVFTNNIIYFDSGRLFTGNWSPPDAEIMDHNIYFDTRAGPSHPALDGSLTFADWQARGHDRHSLFIDPLFVAPQRGDFRLRSQSPALRFGFQPPDLRGVGPRKRFAR